jgi:hypothetical protein
MQLGTKVRAATAVKADVLNSGICVGTTIMTLDGEIPVEHLTVGDRVVTRDSGMAVLCDIRVTTSRLQPICIKAGSLGHPRPDRDMLVTPGARLHIRDWRAEALFGAATVNVEAHRLIDGEFIASQPGREMQTFELVFDRQHILYADGLELLSAAA